MNQDAERLREILAAHERLAPDAASVLAGVRQRARRYQRRRRAAQGAGSAVLGAGLVAGGLNLPSWFDAVGHNGAGSPALAGGPAPSVLPSASVPASVPASGSASGVAASPDPSAAENADVDAFFAAGYTYNDAVALAQAWHTVDPYRAKIEGGQKLLAGQTLPIPPGSQPTPSPTPTAIGISGAPVASLDAADLAAYFAAGYDYNDALQLAQLWQLSSSDIGSVKAAAGAKLLAGQTLPIKP